MASNNHETDKKGSRRPTGNSGKKLRRNTENKPSLREIRTLVASRKIGISSVVLHWSVKVFRGKELIASSHFIETLRTEELYKERPYLKENHR